MDEFKKHFTHFSRGFLPHAEFDHALVFITYRLADSLPQTVFDQWEELKEKLLAQKTLNEQNSSAQPQKNLVSRQHLESHRRLFLDLHLDRGLGSCFLKYPEVAAIIMENWHHFDGDKYRLLCSTIMENHVHILIQLNKLGKAHLPDIIHSWKSYTSHRINKEFGETETYKKHFPDHHFWYNEYWDRYIRDPKHLDNTVNYILQNPVKAGLSKTWEQWPYTWMTDDWDEFRS